jgi:hypothetical protein
MEYAGFVGLIVRLIGAIYAMLSAYFFFDGRMNPSKLKSIVSKALLMEGV